MIIIGVDPGLKAAGYAVIDYDGIQIKVLDSDEVKTSPKDALAVRLNQIYTTLNKICKKYKPDVMVVEKVYTHPKFPQTAVLLAHARGVIFLAGAANNIKVLEIEATSIKKSVTSSGRASKTQVNKMVSYLVGNQGDISSEHAADALAMAITYAYKS